MPQYKAPIRDFQFVLFELFDVLSYKHLPRIAAVDQDLANTLLEEGGRMCEQVLFPLNQSGDEEGVQFDHGKVTLPKGFKEAYETYIASGWTSMTCDTAYGGQNLPDVLSIPIIEMVCSANLSFGMTPGLSHGAYNAIYEHADEVLRKRFLPKMVAGTWTGVMCLTEPQCGTDLGLIRTKAEPTDKGTYKISGSKIFISSGDHDAAENIIHLVLARLPDAPAGVKGISLFLVPKIKVNADGTLLTENHVTCGAIEHKMGIHGSPTCVMNYDGAEGYLVGEAGKGLRAMFTMMNEARLYVGMQGLGLSEVSYQNAAQYAKDRLQGRALTGAKYPEKSADPLIVHPDIRRMLLTMRSFNEGARALTAFVALQIEISKYHEDPKAKQEADDFVQLVTPILKAYFTDMGFESTNLGMQIFGGHGYIREYGMEQYVRDARIAQIYEGANGIQALDLVGRKLPRYTGRYLRSFFHPVSAYIASKRDDVEMAPFTKPLYKAVESAKQASLWVAANGMANPNEAAGASVEYLRLMGITIIGYMWAQMAEVALKKCKENPEDSFYSTKLITAQFYMDKILSQHYSLLASIATGSKGWMAMSEDQF